MTNIDQSWNTYPHWYCTHGYLIGMGCPEHDREPEPVELVGVSWHEGDDQ